jgi:hypothetical protein
MRDTARRSRTDRLCRGLRHEALGLRRLGSRRARLHAI